jgi:hypothetical protein
VVRPLLDRHANFVELKVSGPNGRIEGPNLRLYEPQAGRWNLTFVNIRDGLLTPSVYGGFHDGVGDFFGDDQLGGRAIKVRFLIFRQGPDKARFEEAFSDDGGKTWETNWIAVDTRIDNGSWALFNLGANASRCSCDSSHLLFISGREAAGS